MCVTILRWVLVVGVAVSVALGGMVLAAVRFTPDSTPCLDNVVLHANAVCSAPPTSSMPVYLAGLAAAAPVLVVGFLLRRRNQGGQATR